MNETTDEHSAAWPQPNSSPSRFLRVLRAFAVKVQPRIHREAAESAKISRRKIVSCQQRIFGLVVQMNLEGRSRNQKKRVHELLCAKFGVQHADLRRVKPELRTSQPRRR